MSLLFCLILSPQWPVRWAPDQLSMHLTHPYAMAFPFHQYPTLPAPAMQGTTACVTRTGAAESQEEKWACVTALWYQCWWCALTCLNQHETINLSKLCQALQVVQHRPVAAAFKLGPGTWAGHNVPSAVLPSRPFIHRNGNILYENCEWPVDQSWSSICFILIWFSHFPEWGKDHSHLADGGSAGARYSLESAEPGLVGKSECGRLRENSTPSRLTQFEEGSGPQGVWESDISYANRWFYLNQAKPHSQISGLKPLCKWQNQQTGNDWFQWLHWWRTSQSDFSADLPSASVDNCSPLLKTVSNSFGPLFFILISCQSGNNSFLHLHSYSESVCRW